MDQKIADRQKAMMAFDMESPRRLWWLSFVDGSRPEGTRNLGCTVVEAGGMTEALALSHALGINPGGEVQGVGFDRKDALPEHVDFMLNTLRSRAEIEERGIARSARMIPLPSLEGMWRKSSRTCWQTGRRRSGPSHTLT